MHDVHFAFTDEAGLVDVVVDLISGLLCFDRLPCVNFAPMFFQLRQAVIG